MNKYDVLEILDDLYEEVQWMRENGENDLRTVLHKIDSATRKVREYKEEESK